MVNRRDDRTQAACPRRSAVARLSAEFVAPRRRDSRERLAHRAASTLCAATGSIHLVLRQTDQIAVLSLNKNLVIARLSNRCGRRGLVLLDRNGRRGERRNWGRRSQTRAKWRRRSAEECRDRANRLGRRWSFGGEQARVGRRRWLFAALPHLRPPFGAALPAFHHILAHRLATWRGAVSTRHSPTRRVVGSIDAD